MRWFSILASGMTGLLLGASPLVGQARSSPDGLWQTLQALPQAKGPATVAEVQPQKYQVCALNAVAMATKLQTIPKETVPGVLTDAVVFTLPMPDGSFAQFRVVESPVMAPELAAKYPQIRTYLGQGIDDPHATTRFDSTPAGFHAQILSPHGAVYINPAYKGDTTLYTSYFKRDNLRALDHKCLTNEVSPDAGDAGPADAGDPVYLRTYEFACAASGTFTEKHGGSVLGGLAAVVTGTNRMTGILENEVACRLQLVANNDQIIFTDPDNDGYHNGDLSALLDQNQNILDDVIGSSHYDIGHVVDGNGGGAWLAWVSSVKGEKRLAGLRVQGRPGGTASGLTLSSTRSVTSSARITHSTARPATARTIAWRRAPTRSAAARLSWATRVCAAPRTISNRTAIPISICAATTRSAAK